MVVAVVGGRVSQDSETIRVDVVVVGGGNAALCAALSAREQGARVLVLERAPFDDRGGNTVYTGGGMRTVFAGVEDIRDLVPDLTDEQVEQTNFGAYTAADFYTDMARVTESRTDPDLCERLVEESLPTLRWMRDKGVRFLAKYGQQAFEINNVFTFWGGLVIESWGGGLGLVDALAAAAERDGVRIEYGARAMHLRTDGDRVTGLVFRKDGTDHGVECGAVVLACGGFEANAEWRTRYLGAGWELAKVRGSRYNTGDGLSMALEVGAMPTGNWSGSHATPCDANAPEFGRWDDGDAYARVSYQFGIMVNARGERFVDEGEDFRSYTYAKFGRAILEQPGQIAFQVFDAKVDPALLRDVYKTRKVAKVTADSLEELARRLEGIDQERFLQTAAAFNAAVAVDVPFDPNVKDGRRTNGLGLAKSNWANPLDTPPYTAYPVTCGITFTFGGLKITPRGEVVDSGGSPITGLYACGELVGGLFFFNYPSASGLTSGSVFGRIAGRNAATATVGAEKAV